MTQPTTFTTASYEKLPMLATDPFDLEANRLSSDSLTATDENDDDNDDNNPIQETNASNPNPFQLSPRILSDSILGLSDGMTVPFALTASLSSLGDTRVVVLAGLAELVAGAISMGLGGYLASKTEAAMYNSTRRRLDHDINLTLQQHPRALQHRIARVFTRYEVPRALVRDFTAVLSRSPHLRDFLLRFECGVVVEEEPEDLRAVVSGLTIAAGYFVGGFIPLLPYLLVRDRGDVRTALVASVVTMVVTLFVLGFGKTCLITAAECSGRTGRVFGSVRQGVVGGLQMLIIGAVSAGCAVGLVKGFNALI